MVEKPYSSISKSKMSNRDLSDYESEENPNSSSSDSKKPRGSMNGRDVKDVNEYEKRRLSRIAENKKRMEALGLAKLATSFTNSAMNSKKIDKKGKRKLGEDHDAADEDYKPGEDSSSAEDDDSEEGDGDFGTGKVFESRRMKVIPLHFLLLADFPTIIHIWFAIVR